MTRHPGSGYGVALLVALAAILAFVSSSVGATLTFQPQIKLGDEIRRTEIGAWLVAGPFSIPGASSIDTDFLESLGGEWRARPTEGTVVRAPGGGQVAFVKRQWYVATGETAFLDLQTSYGPLDSACAYLYAEIASEIARGIVLRLDTNDDAAKLWVDDSLLVSRAGGVDTPENPLDLSVDLPAGRTRLLLKIERRGHEWGGTVSILPAATPAQEATGRSGIPYPSIHGYPIDGTEGTTGLHGAGIWFNTNVSYLDIDAFNDHLSARGMPPLRNSILSNGLGLTWIIDDLVLDTDFEINYEEGRQNARYAARITGWNAVARMGYVLFGRPGFAVIPMIGVGEAGTTLKVGDNATGSVIYTKASVGALIVDGSVRIQKLLRPRQTDPRRAGGVYGALQLGYAYSRTTAWSVSEILNEVDLGDIPEQAYRGPYARFSVGLCGYSRN